MEKLNQLIQEHFLKMCRLKGKLFRVALTGDEIWNLYITSFDEGQNPIFRDPNSSSKNCNNCKNFIRRYGNIVTIDNRNNIVSIFDVEADEEYNKAIKALSKAIKASKVKDVFFETFNELNVLPYESCTKSNEVFQLGMSKNVKRYTKEEAEKFGVVEADQICTFKHMHLFLPKEFVDMSGDSVEAVMGNYRDIKNVFQRGMEEISLDTLNLVKDLINQGSLLNGEAHLVKIERMIPLKEEYDSLKVKERDNWCWVKSYKFQYAKFKGELIGTLCTELTEGVELNKAVQSWNKRVDPANYMKATAPITKKQIEEAKQFVEENGYEDSFDRRCATIDDIKVSEIKHINEGKGDIKSVSVFDGVKPTSTRHKRSEFDGIEEVGIVKFMTDILPSCTSVEAFFANAHEKNLVTLTTANKKKSKPIFKWDNNYSWTFNGNLAGKSEIKEAVKTRGGKTEGVLNIRLAFPNTTSDYDLHVTEPNGYEVYYGNRRTTSPCSGMLDLDAQGADGSFPPEERVENIIYTEADRMKKGKYLVYVHNYSKRDEQYGFVLEVEIDGEITTFKYEKYLRGSDRINVCQIDCNNGVLEIIPMLPVSDSNTISKEVYGIETNQFHKVELICLSPNHWGENNVGNKHFFFMLSGCKSPVNLRSFHNENLITDLLTHRKVMEVLGATTMIPSTDKQLSGLGFNATVRNELIVKLQGTHKRMIKIKF